MSVAGDPALGTPICWDCYDYPRAVVWNALAPQLWKRTTIYLRRALARQAGLIAVEAGRQVRPSLCQGGRIPETRHNPPPRHHPPRRPRPSHSTTRLGHYHPAGRRPPTDRRPGRPPESSGRITDRLGRPARPPAGPQWTRRAVGRAG